MSPRMHPSAQPRCRFLSDSVSRLPRSLMGKQGPPTMTALHMFEVLDLKPSPSARIERQRRNPCGSDTLFFACRLKGAHQQHGRCRMSLVAACQSRPVHSRKFSSCLRSCCFSPTPMPNQIRIPLLWLWPYLRLILTRRVCIQVYKIRYHTQSKETKTEHQGLFGP